MKPPRYILREAAFKQLLKDRPAVHFLEVGYGSGQILVTLGEMGYTGAGYDFSDSARTAADGLLKEKNISGISLIDSLDTKRKFELILFFEVMGYFDDPVEKLLQFREMLSDGGIIIFSFTNKKNRGIAEKVTGEMKCFTREEITQILSESGFEVEHIWNYGFPLTNLMRPFLNGYFLLKKKLGKKRSQQEALHESGMEHTKLIMSLIGMIINPVTLYPFTFIQRVFKHSDLGTGYLVAAKKPSS